MKRSFWAVLFAASFLSLSVFAHDVRMQLIISGNLLRGQVLYDDHDHAPDIPVTISDSSMRKLADLVSDSDGRFEFVFPALGEYRVVAESIDGHRADEVFEVTKMSFGTESSGGAGEIPAQRIDEVIERLDRLENKTGLRDILGGIGYVVGLLGLIVLLKQRRNA